MPTYNEAVNIKKMIQELVGKEFAKIKKVEMNLLVVDDNSPDGTGKIVKDYMKKFANLHLLTGEKQGLGMAYVRGMRYAMDKLGADAVIEMDADFQHDPKYVKQLVEEYVNGADYVIGSRYVKGGSIPKGWPWYRKGMSYFGNLFARVMLWKPKLHDMTTGFRLTRVKGVLDQIKLESLRELKRFAHKIDLFYRTVKLAKKVVEVPIHFAERKQDTSKFSFKEMVASYKLVVLIRLEESKRFIRFAVVGFAGYLVNAVSLEIFSGTALVVSLASVFEQTKGTLAAFTAEPSAWAAAFAAELAIINNFTFNNIWTFKEVKITKFSLLLRKFIEFNLTSFGAIVIQFVVIGSMVSLLGDTRLIRQIAILVAMPLVLAFNYTMYNLVIWKTWKSPFAKKT